MFFGPASDDGDFGHPGEGSQKNEGEHSGEGMPDAALVPGIGDLVKNDGKLRKTGRLHDGSSLKMRENGRVPTIPLIYESQGAIVRILTLQSS